MGIYFGGQVLDGQESTARVTSVDTRVLRYIISYILSHAHDLNDPSTKLQTCQVSIKMAALWLFVAFGYLLLYAFASRPFQPVIIPLGLIAN